MGTEHPDLERQGLVVEEEKLAIERQKLQLEKRRAVWSAIGVIIPVIIAAATVVWSAISLQQTALNEILLKAMELGFDAPNPVATKNKLRAMFFVLGKTVSDDIRERVEEMNTATFGGPAASPKIELIKLLAEHPDQHDYIVGVWSVLYKNDAEELKELRDGTYENNTP